MSDLLIKRQDAIDAILSLTNCDTVEGLRAYVIEHDLGSWWSGGVLSSVGKVERLPSAEPKIIRCKDCRRYNGRPCGLVNWYNGKEDFCSRGELKEE